MMREDVVNDRLNDDGRIYEIDIDFDYCDEILKLMDIVRFAYIWEEEVGYVYIRITGFKLWHSLDAFATAHLTVIVS